MILKGVFDSVTSIYTCNTFFLYWYLKNAKSTISYNITPVNLNFLCNFGYTSATHVNMKKKLFSLLLRSPMLEIYSFLRIFNLESQGMWIACRIWPNVRLFENKCIARVMNPQNPTIIKNPHHPTIDNVSYKKTCTWL